MFEERRLVARRIMLRKSLTQQCNQWDMSTRKFRQLIRCEHYNIRKAFLNDFELYRQMKFSEMLEKNNYMYFTNYC